MPTGRRKRHSSDKVLPHAKLWLERDGEYVFGRGISEILKAVERTGSIKAAARRLGKSYRFIWGKIKRTERAIGVPLVHTHVGGQGVHRSDLTDVARDLVRGFDALRGRVFEVVHQEFHEFLRPHLERSLDP